jgi:hypothetical protein
MGRAVPGILIGCVLPRLDGGVLAVGGGLLCRGGTPIGGLLSVSLRSGGHHAMGEGIRAGLEAIAGTFVLVIGTLCSRHGSLLLRRGAACGKQDDRYCEDAIRHCIHFALQMLRRLGTAVQPGDCEEMSRRALTKHALETH